MMKEDEKIDLSNLTQKQIDRFSLPIVSQQSNLSSQIMPDKCQGEKELIIQNIQEDSKQLDNIPQNVRNQCTNIMRDLMNQLQISEMRRKKSLNLSSIYEQFTSYYTSIIMDNNIRDSILNYIQILVKYWKDDQFFQHFVENLFLSVLMTKIRQSAYQADLVRTVFQSLEYLMKGVGSGDALLEKQEQFIYLLVMLNKEGYYTEKYIFPESEDWAYFAHFLKLIVRIINQADKNRKEKENWKYLSIFFNPSTPQFPLLQILLKFYNWPDVILQTSVKLCFLELGNHPSSKLQRYFLNFPFVIFYPLYVQKMTTVLEKLLELGCLKPLSINFTDKQQILIEEFTNDMKFIEDFLNISTSSREATPHLNMYINSFASYITRTFYQHFLKYSLNSKVIINTILLLIRIVIKCNNIMKIQIGLQQMFHKIIYIDYFQFLRTKVLKLDHKYWMLEQCKDLIKQHCSCIFEEKTKHDPSILQKNHKSGISSIFKTVNSYNPISKSNWLFHEINKISQAIGFPIVLNSPLVHNIDQISPNSFLSILDRIQQLQFNNTNQQILSERRKSIFSKATSPLKDNPLYKSLILSHEVKMKKGFKNCEDEEEELAFYYIMLMCSLCDRRRMNSKSSQKQEQPQQQIYSTSIPLKMNIEEMCELLQLTYRCKSLPLVGIMYWYAKIINYQVIQDQLQKQQLNTNSIRYLTDSLLEKLLETMHKLIYYVMTQSWEAFIKRIRNIRNMIWTAKDVYGEDKKSLFNNDIFRDIECDIVYYVLLRHVFGTKNFLIHTLIDQELQTSDCTTKQIKIPCKLKHINGQNAFLLLDGQYILLTNAEDTKIAGPLPINSLTIYQQGNMFEVIDKSMKQQFISAYIQDPMIQYISKEVKSRKQISMQIELALRTCRFSFE